MKRLLILILIFVLTINHSCKKNNADNLIRIPGTKVFFPKSSFSISDEKVGLMKNENTFILITEIPNMDIQESLKSHNKFIKSNSKLNREDLKVGNYLGAHWISEQPNNIKTHILLFGSSTFTTVLSARHNSSDQISEKEIMYLFKNIKYDESLVLDALERAPFYISGNYDEFKNYRNSQNTHFYGKEGQNTKPEKALVIFHGKLNKQNIFEQEYESIWLRKIKEYGIEYYDMSQDKITINGYSGFESIFEYENKGIRKKEFLLFLCDKEKYIVLSAIATENLKNEIEEFKKFSSQIRFKNNSR